VASIESRTVGGKKEYRARWRDAEGKSRRSRWFDRKYDADKLRATVEADLHRGTYVDMANTTTFIEYARQWVAARPHRPRTSRWYANLLKNHIETTPLATRPLVRVRPSEIQAWATNQARVLNPSSVRHHVGVLRSIFATAVLDGVIARNPVMPTARLSLPQREHRQLVPLTVEQVQALAAEMPERQRAMVVTQAGLGLRLGELFALRRQDVDFMRREVHVEHQADPITRELAPPKTPRSRRTVPLPTVVAEALARHMAAFPPATTDAFIFTNARGRLHHRGSYSELFSKAAARAGLPVGISSHDLRHHYASLLLHAGESVHAVAERLGHANATLVLTTYGHLMPDTEDRTRRAVDAAWVEAAAGQREAR
jgi:integrase